jgi:two-component system sensor histidine kinase UhpB
MVRGGIRPARIFRMKTIDMKWWQATRKSDHLRRAGGERLALREVIKTDRGRASSSSVFGRELLRVPLMLKILLANATILVLVVCATAVVSVRIGSIDSAVDVLPELLILAIGLAASVVVNWVILRFALQPLRLLQRTAWRVQEGDVDARAVVSPLADDEMERLARTFNGMLEYAAMYRRRLRDVAARALRATEEERKRIARELHDGTAQALAAIRVQLRVARAMTDPDLREGQLNGVSAEIGEAIEEVRRMARGLRPPSLDMLGLATAIESYARPVAEAAGLEIEFQLPAVAGVVAPDAELALYRIMQEALSNVVHHAGAGRVQIRLRKVDRALQLLIEDDGSGFVVTQAFDEEGRGLGLFGMQERASYVGGGVDITSVPGSGTRIVVSLPIAEAARYA